MVANNLMLYSMAVGTDSARGRVGGGDRRSTWTTAHASAEWPLGTTRLDRFNHADSRWGSRCAPRSHLPVGTRISGYGQGIAFFGSASLVRATARNVCRCTKMDSLRSADEIYELFDFHRRTGLSTRAEHGQTGGNSHPAGHSPR